MLENEPDYSDCCESDFDDPNYWAQVIEENDRANLQWLTEMPFALFVATMESGYARVTGNVIRLSH